jgi:hypothetical protein
MRGGEKSCQKDLLGDQTKAYIQDMPNVLQNLLKQQAHQTEAIWCEAIAQMRADVSLEIDRKMNVSRMAVPDTTQAAMVPTPAGNPKQPGAKPSGQKHYPKRLKSNGKKASNGSEKAKSWDNPQSEMFKMMKQVLEDMCKSTPTRDYTQRSQPFQSDQSGKINKPANTKNEKDIQPARCYSCQKEGHFRRDCRVNIGAVDECCVVLWHCEDHDPSNDTSEQDF